MPDSDITLTVHAGAHDRFDCPISLSLPEPLPADTWELVSESGERRPLQRLDGSSVAFVETALRAGQSREYRTHRLQESDLANSAAPTPPSFPDASQQIEQYTARAQEAGVPFVDLSLFRPHPDALSAVPEQIARRHNVLPLKQEGNTLYLAMADTNDQTALDDVRLASRCQVRGVLAVSEHIAATIDQSYGSASDVQRTHSGVGVTQEEGHITVQHRGALLTRYLYGSVPARPNFFPLIGPSGVGVTRAYPMRPDVPGETRDHHHHRALWIAHGEVNGADNWSEEPGHGYTVHQSVDRLESGRVAGRFATTSLWTTADKQPILTQHLAVTVWATSDAVRLLDFHIRLEATHGEVHFGDTKEGGILAARVASVLDVPRGGRIENVYGGINEAETWGKAAHWCDYSGVVDGQPVGIAILDHPLSFRYPTHWHVRDYGLMTANPFGYAAYTNGAKDGSHDLAAGDSLPFRYRVVLHSGDAAAGRVHARYLDFVAPPKVAVATAS